MTLKEQLGADMEAVLKTDEFAETITYIPQGGTPVSLAALVDRFPLKPTDHGGRQLPTKTIEILIANHATLGVTAVTPRFDKVQLKLNLDDAAETTFVVTKIIFQDPGAWRLEAVG